ncbi:MAG: hypothetical protein IIA67_12770 [Planctomycetes bacterium]|nr:hypothetical protein [Planctomycetota bacterium]
MCSSLTQHLGACVCVLLALFTASCADSPTELATDPIPPAPTDRVEVSPVNVEPANTEVADSTADATVSSPPAKAFEPPYPDRHELFQSPKVRRSTAPERNARNNVQRVRLKGFVDVDEIRAILVVNGQTNALAVGDKSEGVEVLSIKPPRVTLQRGRVRWTESIQ